MKLFPRLAPIALLPTLVLFAALIGCDNGPQIVPLKGKVTYKGEPLKFGSVMLQPIAGQPATAVIEPDGTFVLSTNKPGDGATVGENRVRVTSYEGQAPDAKRSAQTELALGNSLIPVKYTDTTSSGIVVDVKPEGNEDLLIELTDGA
jgi:hypothetical protein